VTRRCKSEPPSRGGTVRFLLTLATLWTAVPARADGRTFGVGVLVGSPAGITAKLYLLPQHALDFAAGAALIGDGGPDVHLDYLWHPAVLADGTGGSLRLYLGVGGRVMEAQNHAGNDLHVGVRVPVGVVGELASAPIDLFGEAAAVLDVVQHNRQAFDFDAGLGVRYYF
jgi:hypothetical protein